MFLNQLSQIESLFIEIYNLGKKIMEGSTKVDKMQTWILEWSHTN
jgi:hypothetical protein